jgi:hypothetical protein
MKKLLLTISLATAALGLLSSCAQWGGHTVSAGPREPTNAEILALLKDSFKETGPAKLDRLQQNELQAACTAAAIARKDLDPATRERLQKAAMAAVKYPSDGKYLGDWKRGEQIAQSGRGLQFSDAPNTVAGGNCYACHQIDRQKFRTGTSGLHSGITANCVANPRPS